MKFVNDTSKRVRLANDKEKRYEGEIIRQKMDHTLYSLKEQDSTLKH